MCKALLMLSVFSYVTSVWRKSVMKKVKILFVVFVNEYMLTILTLYFPMFPFDPPENPPCIQGDQKGTLGSKGLKIQTPPTEVHFVKKNFQEYILIL